MHFKTLFLVLPLTLSAGLIAQDEDHSIWHADYDAAVAAAKESGKSLLVDFTGSDWCGWCIKLDNEVFSTEEFKTKVPEMFELVKLDFPRGDEAKAKVPNPERNKELGEKYGVRGYPSVLAMTADGVVFARTGYAAGGPTPYVENLSKLFVDGQPRLFVAEELVPKYEAAEGAARAKLLPEVVGLLAGAASIDSAVEKLAGPVEAAFDSGDLKKAGLLEEGVGALLAAGRANDAICDAAREIDPKNEAGMLDSVVKAQFSKVTDDASARAALEALDGVLEVGMKDKDLQQNLLFTAVQWTARPLNDKERARGYFAKLQEVAGEDFQKQIDACKQLLGDD